MIEFRRTLFSIVSFLSLVPALFSFTAPDMQLPIQKNNGGQTDYIYDPHPYNKVGIFYSSTFHYKFYIINDVSDVRIDIQCQNMLYTYEKTKIAYDFTFMFDQEGKAKITIQFINEAEPDRQSNSEIVQFYKAEDRVYYCNCRTDESMMKEVNKEEWKRNQAKEIQKEAYSAILQRPDDWNGNFWITERIKEIPQLYVYFKEIEKPYGYSDSFYWFRDDHNRYHEALDYPNFYIIMDNDGDLFIHSMKIIDPEATFYGLSIQSSIEDIQNVLRDKPGFTVTIPQFKTGLRAIATYEEKIDFLFFEDSISIQMPKDLPEVILTDEDYNQYMNQKA